MRNLDDELHAKIEIAIVVCEVEPNPHISFYLTLESLSGIFYTDLESVIALRFELDNAIKKAEGMKNEENIK